MKKHPASARRLAPAPDCPNCKKNSEKWGRDVLIRISDWQALLAVACKLTGKTQKEIVTLVVQEKDKNPF